MSGTFQLAPGVEVKWTGDATERDVWENFSRRGGAPGWRPHFPEHVENLLIEMGQEIVSPQRAGKIPEIGYELLNIKSPDDKGKMGIDWIPLPAMSDPFPY